MKQAKIKDWREPFRHGEIVYDELDGIIICGDCREILPKFPEKSVDLCLTDPPYGANREYANDNLDNAKHVEFINQQVSAIQHIISKNGNVVYIVGIKYQAPFFVQLVSAFNYGWQYVLYKSNGMMNGKASFAKWDSILWVYNGNVPIHNRQPNGIFSGDVWPCPITPTKNDFGHPTPKDILPVKGCVTLFSNPNQIILDPFLGSGTTAVAAVQLGRRFIGIEISKEYCELAVQRIHHAKLSQRFDVGSFSKDKKGKLKAAFTRLQKKRLNQ